MDYVNEAQRRKEMRVGRREQGVLGEARRQEGEQRRNAERRKWANGKKHGA